MAKRFKFNDILIFGEDIGGSVGSERKEFEEKDGTDIASERTSFEFLLFGLMKIK